MISLAFILFFLSGALGLLYEVVWLRLLVLVFGSTHVAVTSVLTAFMGGLALGGFVFGRYTDSSRRRPLLVYGVLEIGIGVCAFAVLWLLDPLGPGARLIAARFNSTSATVSLVRFLLPLVVLLVPTLLMGGTLPVLSRFITQQSQKIGGSVGLLYGVNTCGAVLGTAVTGFWLIPWLGVSRTTTLAACANFALGGIALLAARQAEAVSGGGEARAPIAPAGTTHARKRKQKKEKPAGEPAQAPRRLVLWAAAGSGLLALVYEIAWTRVLVLILGSSVYAFTVMLATFLTGLATGALAGARLGDRLQTQRRLLQALAATITLAAVAGYATVWLLPSLPSAFAWSFDQWRLAGANVANDGSRLIRLLSLELMFAFLVMFPATLFMGMVFPLVVRMSVDRLDVVGRGVGTAYAASTSGTVVGALAAGFVILPIAGLQRAILTAVAGGLLLAATLIGSLPGSTRVRRVATLGVAAGLIAALVAGRPPWDPMVMNSGIYQYAPDLGGVSLTSDEFASLLHEDTELLHYEEGLTANVLVARQPSSGNTWMSINGKIDASSNKDLETQLLLGHLPMLVDTGSVVDRRQVVLIGYATGITTGAVTRHDPVRVVAVEIEPAVLRASRFFDAFNHKPLSDPRVRAVEADGRSFLLSERGAYDVIISEPSSPWMTMAANLFTREFFELGRRRLAPGGIFAQWLQLYGLTTGDLRSLMKTFTTVFSHVTIFWTTPGQDIVLLGSDAPLQIDLGHLESAMSTPEVAQDLARIDIRSVEDLLVYYLLGDAEARAFIGDAPLNTDDNALIEFRAPLTMHDAKQTGEANTQALDALAADPLAHASGFSAESAPRASLYRNLGRAFARKQLFGRAVDAVRRAQEIYATEEGARLLASYVEADVQAKGSR